MQIKRMTMGGLAALLWVATATAAPPIDRLAPDSTVIFLTVDDAEQTIARFHRSSLAKLVEGLPMPGMNLGQGPDGDGGHAPLPSGRLGYALFTTMNEEIGLPEPGMLAVADYGDRADAVWAMLDGVLEKAAGATGGPVFEEREIRGRTVRVFDVTEHLEGLEAGELEDTMPAAIGDVLGMLGMGGLLGESFGTLHLVREKNTFILCTEASALRGALTACDGEANACLADRADYAAVLKQIGPGDMRMGMLTRDIGSAAAAFDPMGITAMFGPMIRQVVGDIGGMGVSFRIDGPQAMIEETVGLYMPHGKSGLAFLLDRPAARGPLPPFVGADVYGFNSMNFAFDGLPTVLRPVFQMAQMFMMQMDEGGGGPNLEETMSHFCSCLGRRMYIVHTLADPEATSTDQGLVAIEAVKPDELGEFLAFAAEGMGLETAEMLGHKVYRVDQELGGMMPPMGMPGMPGGGEPGRGDDPAGAGVLPPSVVGVAGGYLFAGPEPAVESALRTLAAEERTTLADHPALRRAAVTLGDEPVVAWGVYDLTPFIESIDDMLAGMMDRPAEMPMDAMRSALGPSAWAMHSTPGGFVVKAYLLDGAKEAQQEDAKGEARAGVESGPDRE